MCRIAVRFFEDPAAKFLLSALPLLELTRARGQLMKQWSMGIISGKAYRVDSSLDGSQTFAFQGALLIKCNVK